MSKFFYKEEGIMFEKKFFWLIAAIICVLGSFGFLFVFFDLSGAAVFFIGTLLCLNQLTWKSEGLCFAKKIFIRSYLFFVLKGDPKIEETEFFSLFLICEDCFRFVFILESSWRLFPIAGFCSGRIPFCLGIICQPKTGLPFTFGRPVSSSKKI